MSAAAELAASLEAAGCTAAAPREHPMSGVAASLWILPDRLETAARSAKRAGFFYESMTCVDRVESNGGFELIYTFNRFEEPSRVALRVLAPKDQAVVSLAGVFAIAAWNEREVWEFYGLAFDGHPDLKWLLLPEDTEFRPLLKSFTAPPPSIYDDSLHAGS